MNQGPLYTLTRRSAFDPKRTEQAALPWLANLVLTRPMVIRTFAITLALATVLTAGTALACRCIRYANAADQLRTADVMFIGRAEETAVEHADGVSRAVTRFSVQRTIKGHENAVRSVVHGTSPTMCGKTFQPGRTYTILASFHDGRLWTGACSAPQFPLSDYVRAASGR